MVDSCWFYHTYNLLGILMEIFNSAYIQFVQMLILYWFLHGWPKYDKESLVEREEKLIQMYLISSLTTQKSFNYHRLWDKQNNCAICQIWHNDKYIICSKWKEECKIILLNLIYLLSYATSQITIQTIYGWKYRK